MVKVSLIFQISTEKVKLVLVSISNNLIINIFDFFFFFKIKNLCEHSFLSSSCIPFIFKHCANCLEIFADFEEWSENQGLSLELPTSDVNF